MPNDKVNHEQHDALSEFMLEKVSGGKKPVSNKYDASGDNRESNKLYYRKNVVDQSMTPTVLASQYSELSGFMLQMKLFGYDNRPLSELISNYGLVAVQNLIDSYTD